MNGDIATIAQAQQEYVVGVRRELHKHPELRWEEATTLNTISAEIEKIGATPGRTSYPMVTSAYRGGLVLDILVDKSLEKIVLRADTDGLPIQEATGLSFASQNPGVMHACGHDVHSAMLLGFLRAIMLDRKLELKHNLRLIWQRAEENPVTRSGGDVIANDEGVLDGVTAAYGLHVWATGESGLFQSRPGAFLANSGRLGIRVKTTGGHVARPQDGVNAARVVQAIMNAVDTFAQTSLDLTEPRGIEPVIVKTGTASNVMPAEAEMWFSVRTMLPGEEHRQYLVLLETKLRHVVAGFPGSSVEFERVLGHPALINTPNEVNRTAGLLTGNDEDYADHLPIMGGEDFAYYLQKVPGAFFMLGTKQEGAGDHHSPTFAPNESVFWRGVHYWLLLATSE